ncbi:NAD-dependent epimerase/dehydratase family protein [Streptomyces sp. NPDC093108]|uniref:NAD-dependent epimerase/dehydratase family protein n=1 Tax=Streptomyces sp. NPDC093108 TaxID=3366030 RepID=UPI00380330FE
MKILVLGGTWFLGRAVVTGALARGWAVTVFNRGRSAPDPAGVKAVHGDRTSIDDIRRLAQEGPWDAVIDTSSSDLAPREVLICARALDGQVGRWVHISTVSVYAQWPRSALTETSSLLDAPADADATFGYTGADGTPTAYGFQKAGGERAVSSVFADSAVFLRPGVILGPGEYVGRLPWWLSRAHRGGSVLAPGPADRCMQPVDVRDVAAFALDQARSTARGGFNVTHPVGISFEAFLAECFSVSGGLGYPVWVAAEDLLARDVRQWTELPLWRTHPGVWSVDSARAIATGLRCRPVVETIRDTWAWMEAGGRPVSHPRWAEHGISREKEQAVLASVHRSRANGAAPS